MKKVLFPILAVVLALSLALPMAAVAGANGLVEYIETIYLADTHEIGTDDGTTIFTVELVDDALNKANLTEFCQMPDDARYDTVAALACSPDGGTLYVIDRDTTWLAKYDIASSTWTQVAATGLNTCVQLVCSLDGTLYAASNATDSLYTVDTSTAATTLLGVIKEGATTVNVQGADIVFGVDASDPPNEILYLWTDGGKRGLYTLSLPPSGGVVSATWLGSDVPTFTGLAIRAGGAGDLLGSNTTNDRIEQLSRSNGSIVKSYDMYMGGSPYAYEWGDMTVGELAVEVGEPSITIDKTSDADGFATINDVITYHYDVENTGDVVLENLTVVDTIGAHASVPAVPVKSGDYNVGDDDPQDGFFDPGEIWEFECEHTIVEADLLNCRLHDFALATAYYESEPVTATDDLDIEVAKIVNLWAGKDTDVGGVEIWNDGTTLHVTYSTDDGWVLTETHLYVGSNEPPTNAPGQFPYDDSDAVSFTDTEVIFEIPLADIYGYMMKLNKKGKETGVMITNPALGQGVDPGEPIYIAAHSVVQKVDSFSECLVSGAASDEVLLLAEGDPGYPVGYTAPYQTYTGVPASSVLAWTHSAWAPYGIAGAEWISSSEYTEDPDNNTWRLFTRSFDLPASATNISGTMTVNCDNAEEVYLNTVFVGDGSPAVVYGDSPPSGPAHGWSSVEGPWDVSSQLQAGTNNLWTMTRNYGWPGGELANPTALIYKLCYSYDIVTTETAWGGWGDFPDITNVIPFDEPNWSNYIEYFVMNCDD